MEVCWQHWGGWFALGAMGVLPGLGVLQSWCHQALWGAGTAPGVFVVWSLPVHSVPVVYAGAAAGAARGTSAGRALGAALALTVPLLLVGAGW